MLFHLRASDSQTAQGLIFAILFLGKGGALS